LPTPFQELQPDLDPKAVVEDQDRCNRLFQQFLSEQEGETTLPVCHGNLIRYLLCRVLNLPGEGWLRLDINNCGICRVDWKTVLELQVTGFNDVGHLPLEMITYG
jgi:serine/threonine-protein phosphatase PGAM5